MGPSSLLASLFAFKNQRPTRFRVGLRQTFPPVLVSSGCPPVRFRPEPKSKPVKPFRSNGHEIKVCHSVRMLTMMKWLTTLLLAIAISTKASQTIASKTHKSSTSKSPSNGSRKPTHSSATKRQRVQRHSTTPTFQLHPDPARYQEIQKALADRGYFKGEVNGVWGPDSVEALQRFQADQKLPNDGKINALTLIALGLGPKHNSIATVSPGSKVDPATAPSFQPANRAPAPQQ
jgi:hypothetical protein